MIYPLTAGNLTAAVDTLGAELISLQKNGKEYIWNGNPAYWNGHNPTLFPVIGFLKDGKTHFNGIEYEIPKHGYARKSEFNILCRDERSITMEMSDNEETRKGYPFRFALQITHCLTEDGFKPPIPLSIAPTVRCLLCSVPIRVSSFLSRKECVSKIIP